MIPYDDLVIALQTWRARQGLPVAQMSGIIAPPPVVAAPPAAVPRTNPPAPPKAAVPPPLAPVDTRDEDVDASLLEEAHYENEGDDFAMAFQSAINENAGEEVDESTSIGTPPPPGSERPRDSFGGSTEPEPGPGKHNDDW